MLSVRAGLVAALVSIFLSSVGSVKAEVFDPRDAAAFDIFMRKFELHRTDFERSISSYGPAKEGLRRADSACLCPRDLRRAALG